MIKKELFICKRDGLHIKGMKYIPDKGENKSEKLPAIIVSHGFSGDYSSEDRYCTAFAEMGYASFCFSFCGGSKTETDEALKSVS